MNDPTSFRTLIEKVSAENEVYKIKLPVPVNQLTGVFSKEAMDLHYGTLYGNYVKNALAGDGEFQIAGAKLHTLFFEQFQEATIVNNPTDAAKKLIDNKFDSYKAFKDAFIEAAMGIHGSGWAYLDTKGNIKTIANHKDVGNIVLLIDMWEHAYLEDYKADKEKYLKNVWQIINWNIVNKRLGE
jgi:Fe-Mn family superoxide dismutase